MSQIPPQAAYYLALTEEAELKLSSAEQKQWLDRLEQELANLRAVLHWSIEQQARTVEIAHSCDVLCFQPLVMEERKSHVRVMR